MTVTVEEAQARLIQIIARVEAGEEVLIAREPDHPTVKLVAITSGAGRLARHPDLIGSTTTHDPAALVHPLPPEEWGDLAEPTPASVGRKLKQDWAGGLSELATEYTSVQLQHHASEWRGDLATGQGQSVN